MNEPTETPGAPSPRLDPELAEPVPVADKHAVLRIRDFQLYVGGRFIASFGQQMLGTAVGWDLYERTNSYSALAFVGMATIVPLLLLTLPAGHVAEQHDRRMIIVWMEVLTAVSSLGLTVVSWLHAPVLLTFAFLALSAAARAFLWPASQAILPQLVPRSELPAAITWNSGSFQISAALGPVAGGLLYHFCHTASVVYAFNVVAALVCAWLVRGIRTRLSGLAQRQKMTVAVLRGGLDFVFRTPIILATISLDLFAVLLGGATALMPVYARDILHVGVAGQGFLQAALPIGSASMAFVLAYRPPMQKAGRSLLLAVAGFGLATIVFGLSTSFWLSMAMMFVCGATDNISVVVRQTLVQILTPDALRGRVSAINMLFISTSNEFGEVESGFVANYLGPVATVVAGGIGTILVVLATGAIWPSLRKFGRLDEEPAKSIPAAT